jgi:hypothetical protein
MSAVRKNYPLQDLDNMRDLPDWTRIVTSDHMRHLADFCYKPRGRTSFIGSLNH